MTLHSHATQPIFARALYGIGLALALGGCSSDLALWRADWAWWRSSPPTSGIRSVGPEAFVGPDGACPAAESEQVARGVGLGMTECDLVRLAGPTEKVDIGTNERGERTAVITYTRGERAGIYRFTSGQLTTMDRVEEPAPPPPPKRRTRPVQRS